MKLPLTTLLPPQVKALLAALQAIPWRILLEVSMLVVIYLLWSLLGDAKVDLGRAKQNLNQSQAALVLCQKGIGKLEASQKITDDILKGNQVADGETDVETQKLLKQLQEKANVKKCDKQPVGKAPASANAGSLGISGLDRLLDMASCTAKQNGVPCSSGSSSPPL